MGTHENLTAEDLRNLRAAAGGDRPNRTDQAIERPAPVASAESYHGSIVSHLAVYAGWRAAALADLKVALDADDRKAADRCRERMRSAEERYAAVRSVLGSLLDG